MLILDLEPAEIIGRNKVSYRQRIPGSSCPREDAVDIEILVTCRNVDRKIIQSIRLDLPRE